MKTNQEIDKMAKTPLIFISAVLIFGLEMGCVYEQNDNKPQVFNSPKTKTVENTLPGPINPLKQVDPTYEITPEGMLWGD